MKFLIPVLAGLIVATSCDCRTLTPNPAELFEDLVEGHSDELDPDGLHRFQKALEKRSLEELYEVLSPLDQVHSRDDQKTAAWIKPAQLVITEVWSRDPSLRSLIGLTNANHFAHEPRPWIVLTSLAGIDPEGTWARIHELHLSHHRSSQANPAGAVPPPDYAIPFIVRLYELHPEMALRCLKPLLEKPTYGTGQLKSDTLSGILQGLSTPAEARKLIHWLRQNHLADQPVGSLGLHGNSLKINPTDLVLNHAITSALIVFAEHSPQDARHWIRQKKQRGTLPGRWALAYLLGCARNRQEPMDEAFRFVTAQMESGDGSSEAEYWRWFALPASFERKLEALREAETR